MAILNVTPDSFFDKSRVNDTSDIEHRVIEIISQGAQFIDIGAFSTRPGAQLIEPETEIKRLRKGMEIVRRLAPDAIVSVDTFRSAVAQVAVSELGCDIVNDVSGGEFDSEMFRTVAKLKVPYILTHNASSFDKMHSTNESVDITAEVLRWFGEKIKKLCLLGVNDIIIDPGIGFAKSLEQNYQLISNLQVFNVLGHPILLGISRKSLLCRLFDITPSEALNSTTALNAFGLERGAAILRVHDVVPAQQCIKIYQQLNPEFNRNVFGHA